ncbi:MAG: permease, partial [Kangiellaceae bacterium]|nr:permease [Kangiellaceae bacterium]
LGPFFAIIRPISAVFTAIYAGVIVKLFAVEEQEAPSGSNLNQNKQESSTSCCSSKGLRSNSCCDSSAPINKVDKHKERCCASKKMDDKPETLSLTSRLASSIAFSSGKLLSDITKWLLIGLLLAAAIKTWVSTDFLLQWGDGFVAMLAMALIGIPMYICATASTPLAAGFLAAGLSPGAILVFMLAGPATNIATMGMIKQEMGSKVLAGYLFSLFTASIGIGYLANWLITSFSFEIPVVAAQEHVMGSSLLYVVCSVLLAVLMIRNTVISLRG